MADELTIDGKQYVSSKRASQLSGYTQDYTGQLARGGHIDAQRIGGLWYVHMDSLLSYKKKADAYTPQPPQVERVNTLSDAIVTFEGKDYVSASRASEITGYHQDYVGQLARSGKINSRQVGTRWYVDREALLAHKREKDALLGAVQAQSVGIQKQDTEEMTYEQKIGSLTPYRYSNEENRALIPDVKSDKFWRTPPEIIEEETSDAEDENRLNPLPIRVIPERRKNPVRPTFKTADYRTEKARIKNVRVPRNTIVYAIISIAVLGLIIVISVGSFVYYSQPGGAKNSTTGDAGVQAGGGSSAAGFMGKVADFLEPLVTHELNFNRGDQAQ